MILRSIALLGALGLAGCGAGSRGSGPPATTPGPAAPDAIEVAEAWRWPAPPPGSVGMPTADGDGVATTYGHLRLVLLDLDGGVRWELERLHLRDVAPALTPDLVVAATEEGLLAVDRATGRLRWDTEVGERANGPVVVGGRAVVSTWEGSLVAFDLADGAVAWRTDLPGPAIGPAATDGDAVAVTWESSAGDAAGVVVVDGADGRQRWSAPVEPGGVGGPAIVPVPTTSTSVVVFVAGDLAVHGLDLVDGGERWRIDTDGRGSPEVPPLLLGDGEVLVADRLGGLLLVDAGTADVRGRFRADGAATRGAPVGAGPDGPFAFPLDDGRVFLVGPELEVKVLDWPGRVSGLAMAPGGRLLVATREARANHLLALDVGVG